MSLLNIPRQVPTPEQAFNEMMGGQRETEYIPIDRLLPFDKHPFRPYTPEKLAELAESIKNNELFVPIIVRKMGMDCYQILAGHNRVAATKLLGIKTIRAEIKDVNDHDATIIMLDTNLQQRIDFLPSELAKAYQMRLETMKRKAGRPAQDDPSSLETSLRSDEELAKQVGKSRAQVQRYIRLNFLLPSLLVMVDEKTLPLGAGVALSYLTEPEQRRLHNYMTLKEAAISLEQAEALKKQHDERELLLADIEGILDPPKATKPPREAAAKPITIRFQIPQDKYSTYFPGMKPKEAAALFEEIMQEWLEKRKPAEGMKEEYAG